MPVNFQTPRVVIMQFPSYTGGKFISNCLSFSRHACPQHAGIAEHLLQNPTDYEYRSTALYKTLPTTQSDMIDWIGKYELGDIQLYGQVKEKWAQTGQANEKLVNTITEQLSNSQLHFFIVCHNGPEMIKNLIDVWPNARIIMLVNFVKFFQLSQQLKSKTQKKLLDCAVNYCEEKYNTLKGKDWPSWQQFQNAKFNTNNLTGFSDSIVQEIQSFYKWYQILNPVIEFNIDSTIFDRHKFLRAMENLYKQLDFDDFDAERIGNFWQQYIKLHVDKTQ